MINANHLSTLEIYKASRNSLETAQNRISDKSKLKEVCDDFESLFVKMMLDAMRSSLSDDTLIPKNSGEKLFEDQLYSEYARKISHTANLGISEMMYQQLEDTVPNGTNLQITV